MLEAPGGEGLLLDEFEGLGLHCDPGTQLVVTCEVCGRPSTKDCWTCGMRICDFCTLKRHWKARRHGAAAHAARSRPKNKGCESRSGVCVQVTVRVQDYLPVFGICNLRGCTLLKCNKMKPRLNSACRR